MKLALLIIGENIRYNYPLIDYIHKEVRNKIGKISSTVFIDNEDKDLLLLFDEITKEFTHILIFSSQKSFNLIGKILSTLTEDNLILKEEMLLPSKVKIYEKNSYLLKYKESLINVLLTKEGEKLPNILMDSLDEERFFFVIDMDKEAAKSLIDPIAQSYDLKLSYSTVVPQTIYIRIQKNRFGEIEKFIKNLKESFPEKIIDHKSLISFAIEKLIEQKEEITCVESCTGGLIASMITSHPGVSSIFKGSLVTYDNKIKEHWVLVSEETLKNFGAVSEQCVREMLDGVLKITGAKFAMAVSGIAGPTGGTPEKPVGTVYVGARAKDGEEIIERLFFKGDRNYIQKQAAIYAFKLLVKTKKEIFF